MIRHISFDAHNPLRVKSVLAEIWNGKAYQFFYPGSYTVMPYLYHRLCFCEAFLVLKLMLGK